MKFLFEDSFLRSRLIWARMNLSLELYSESEFRAEKAMDLIDSCFEDEQNSMASSTYKDWDDISISYICFFLDLWEAYSDWFF